MIPLASYQGIPVQVMKFREDAGISVVQWGLLAQIIPNPTLKPVAVKALGQPHAQYAELRKQVQRLFTGAKGKNLEDYAHYLAQGILGKLGPAWSAPPLCLWSSVPLTFVDPDNGIATIKYGSYFIVVMDGETQFAARCEIAEDPAKYGFNTDKHGRVIDLDAAGKVINLDEQLLAVEIYWGMDEAEARQIFHDRNWKGVVVDKNLALGMDLRDLGTILARRASNIQVDVEGSAENFGNFVNSTKRQLGKTDKEWLTLSAARSMAILTMYGKPGFELTSETVETPPPGTNDAEVKAEVPALMSVIFREFTNEFAARSAITAPAIQAGIGALLHHATPWTRETKMSRQQVVGLLAEVNWSRGEHWGGVGAKITQKGNLSFAGGVKDQGYAVYEALLNEFSPNGQQIRGRR